MKSFTKGCVFKSCLQSISFRRGYQDSFMCVGAALSQELQDGEAAFERRFQGVFGNSNNKGVLHQGMQTLRCLLRGLEDL